MLSNTPMSEAERIRAIQAAAGYNYSTALPTDKSDPLNVVGNVKSNLSSIFTGLSGFVTGKAEANLWDTVKQTFEHPSTVIQPIEWLTTFGQMGKSPASIAQQNNDIWNLVPGVWDASMIWGGHKSQEQLLTEPVSALLDIIPAGRVANSVLARTARGEAIAAKLGMTTQDLAKLGPGRTAWRVLRTQPIPKSSTMAFVKDAAGQVVDVQPQTFGKRIDSYRNTLGIGKEQGDIIKNNIIRVEEGNRLLYDRVSPALKAMGDLKPAENELANQLLYSTEGLPRPREEVLHDPRITPEIHDALEEVYRVSDIHKQLQMQAGEGTHIETPFGPEYYTTRPGDSGEAVLRAKSQMEDAQITLDKAAKPFDALIYKVQLMDNNISPMFATMEQMTQEVYQIIKRMIPEADAAEAERLRAALPTGERWDRTVPRNAPGLKDLFGLTGDERLSLHHLNAIRDLVAPGGLLDQMNKAYNEQDWVALSKFSRVANRKFNNKVFSKIPTGGRAVLMRLKLVTKSLHDYAVQREKDTNALTRMFDGTRKGEKMSGKFIYGKSIAGLSQKLAAAHNKFLEVAIKNPPAVWRNMGMDEITNQVLNNEHAAKLVDDATAAMKKIGYGESEVDKMRQDPRTILEIMDRASKNSLENNMIPEIPYGLAAQFKDNMYAELASLRARGEAPEYLPTVPSGGASRALNISLSTLRPKKVSATFDRLYEYTPSINDIQLAITHGAREMITRDVRNQVMEDTKPYLLDAGEIQAVLMKHMATELGAQAERNAALGYREMGVPALVEKRIKDMGYVNWDPDSIFGPIGATASLSAKQYIHKDLLSALDQSVNKFTLPAQGFMDRATRLFRFSILGLSPRYTAHIVFGGTFLIALRGHASMLTHLNEARYLAYSGDPSRMRGLISKNWADSRATRMAAGKERILEKYPHAEQAILNTATQEGMEDIYYHMAGGNQAGQWLIQSWLANRGLPHNRVNHLQAASALNIKFTRTVVRMQRAVVYLDGAARALDKGYFHENEIIPELDARGEPVINPATGKPQYTEQLVRRDMSPGEAHQEGMRAMSEVMGDLRHMTPTERNIFQKFFPFYGWTKHILTYVLTYPLDHPYRAMFLSQLAEQQSQDVASGLPLRIQLLLFLGQPDQFGNVPTLDVRALNPLRDTANYASTQGLLQSLNPVISAIPAYVDPQIVYGSNVRTEHFLQCALWHFNSRTARRPLDNRRAVRPPANRCRCRLQPL